jgi:pimeloyl-ACP methyl ester carboxylesterase
MIVGFRSLCAFLRSRLGVFILVLLHFSGAAHAQTPFYDVSAQDLVGRPGTIIRQEPVSGAPPDSNAFRVLYRSTSFDGRPIAVSGLVIIPTTPDPVGGRAVVAWAHPTSGIVPHCAPSLAAFKFQQIQGLRDMLDHGYVVAATDYPGLGTAGPHPYLVGMSEGYAVLDSIRAARAVAETGTIHRTALWGHSQGGQAVLYAGLLARSYAPELEVTGIAAAAPAIELGTLLDDDLASPGGKNLLAMTLWSWSRVFKAPLAGMVDPEAMGVIDRLANVCLESLVDIMARQHAGEDLQRRFLLVKNPTEMEPWRTLLAENTIGALPPGIPVLLVQGSADDTIRPAVTQDYMRKLCAGGSRVQMLTVPGVGHGMIAVKTSREAVGWISEGLAGKEQAVIAAHEAWGSSHDVQGAAYCDRDAARLDERRPRAGR